MSVVIKVVSERSHDDGQVAAHQVHEEEEDGDAGGAHLRRDNLHNDCEQDSKPGLCQEVVSYQAA